MTIEIPQEKLKKALSVIEKVSSKSPTLPILNNILLSAEKNILKLSATDLEVGANFQVLGKVSNPGQIAVSGRLLFGFINLLPGGNVSLSVSSQDLIVESGKYRTKIKGLLADEFPIIPKVEEDDFVLINSINFCSSLTQVYNIPAPSTARPEISGVYFSFNKNSLVLAATDSFRLGEKNVGLIKSNLKKSINIIIPQKTAREIINIFSEEEKELKVSVSDSQIMIESFLEGSSAPNIMLTSRLIDGEYPAYSEIIPQKHITSITLPRKDFLNHIKGASLFVNKNNEVKLKINSKKGTLEILASASAGGDYSSTIEGSVLGEDVEIVFNYRFLIDGLASILSEKVLFELNGDSGPAVLKPSGGGDYLYVVMPIKSS